MADTVDIAQVRAFNRFYTRIIGLLNEGMHQTHHTLAEARVIYELAQTDTATSSAIAGLIGMDRGQMSRLIGRLMTQGLVENRPHDGDGRTAPLALTAEGRAVAARFDEMSSAAVAATMLDPVSPFERQDLVRSMRHIAVILGEPDDEPLVLRPHRVGELGWLIHRQGLLYALEQGWSGAFEDLITRIYAEYVESPIAPPKALWVAERGGVIAGSVFIIPAAGEPEGTAQLRMLYVEPMFRGQGIGQRLVAEAIAFARASGYRRIMLWTQDCLVAARRIYQAAGFSLVREDRHQSFGADLNGQYWVLEL